MSTKEEDAASISKLRKEYSEIGIDESTICLSPVDMFKMWFTEAQSAKVLEPNAMCLATCSKDSCAPSARYVLLKGYDERGFVWFTNYKSRKGSDLEENPQAGLCFWWGELERSVRIEGRVEKVSEEESTEYFESRPVSARLGAISSDQSSAIASREALEGKFAAVKGEHLNDDGTEKKKVERPEHWGGYRLVPRVVEFWKGRHSRIHDRLRYTRGDHSSGEWSIERLQP